MPKSRKSTSDATPSPSRVQIDSGSREPQSTEEKKASPQPKQVLPRFLTSKDYISVYANHAFFNVNTIWDMRINFGEVRGVEANQLVVENHVSVTMPLAVAKMLAIGIQANLQQFEKQTGKTVDLPPLDFTRANLSPDTTKLEAKEPTEQK